MVVGTRRRIDSAQFYGSNRDVRDTSKRPTEPIRLPEQASDARTPSKKHMQISKTPWEPLDYILFKASCRYWEG